MHQLLLGIETNSINPEGPPPFAIERCDDSRVTLLAPGLRYIHTHVGIELDRCYKQ